MRKFDTAVRASMAVDYLVASSEAEDAARKKSILKKGIFEAVSTVVEPIVWVAAGVTLASTFTTVVPAMIGVSLLGVGAAQAVWGIGRVINATKAARKYVVSWPSTNADDGAKDKNAAARGMFLVGKSCLLWGATLWAAQQSYNSTISGSFWRTSGDVGPTFVNNGLYIYENTIPQNMQDSFEMSGLRLTIAETNTAVSSIYETQPLDSAGADDCFSLNQRVSFFSPDTNQIVLAEYSYDPSARLNPDAWDPNLTGQARMDALAQGLKEYTDQHPGLLNRKLGPENWISNAQYSTESSAIVHECGHVALRDIDVKALNDAVNADLANLTEAQQAYWGYYTQPGETAPQVFEAIYNPVSTNKNILDDFPRTDALVDDYTAELYGLPSHHFAIQTDAEDSVLASLEGSVMHLANTAPMHGIEMHFSPPFRFMVILSAMAITMMKCCDGHGKYIGCSNIEYVANKGHTAVMDLSASAKEIAKRAIACLRPKNAEPSVPDELSFR